MVEQHRPRLGIVGRLLKEKDGKEKVAIDEDDVVEGIVLMRKYEKSLVTAELVEKKLEEIQTSGILPKGMTIRVFNQRTDLVHVTTHNVLHNLVVGMILVVADPLRLPRATWPARGSWRS